MGLDNLLSSLEMRGSVTSVTSCNPTEATAKPASIKACTPVTSVTPQNGQTKREERKGGAHIIAAASRWWQFHYTDRELKEASYSPAATYAEAIAGEPTATTAEPFEPVRRQPDGPLTSKEEASVRALLAAIGETDEGMISMALEQCHTDQDAREAFLRMAKKVVTKGDCRIDQTKRTELA